jgi:hypothetical protein
MNGSIACPMSVDAMQERIRDVLAREAIEEGSTPLDFMSPPMQMCLHSGLEDWAHDVAHDGWTMQLRRGKRIAVHRFLYRIDHQHGVEWHHGRCPSCEQHVCDVCRRKYRRCEARHRGAVRRSSLR